MLTNSGGRVTGFTLIEMLVVIGIIAVLAAILIPVVGMAREKGRQSSCTNNQRQIATAVLLYAHEHEQTLPDSASIWSISGLDTGIKKCLTAPQYSNAYVYNNERSEQDLGAIRDPSAAWVSADGRQGLTPANIAVSESDVDPRHNGKAIFAYIDGHAAMRTATGTPNPGGGGEPPPPPPPPPPTPVKESPLGINLGGIADWSTEMMFVDVFKRARVWISQEQGKSWGQGPALDLDADGWVKSLGTNCYVETFMVTPAGSSPYPKGIYVVLYDGEGTFKFPNGTTVVSSQPGRIEVDTTGLNGAFSLQLRTTTPANYVKNIRVVMPGYESTYAANPFTPAFLARYEKFSVFRYMDWMDTNGSPIKEWADRPRPDSFSMAPKGVALEWMIKLSNTTKKHPWFCMPHQASDNYIRQFATLVKQQLDPSLKVYIEYSNEVWNSGFAQNQYAQQQALALGIGPPSRPWEGAGMFYAKRSVEIFKIWEEVFGGKERLVRVIAWQAAGGSYWSDGIVLSYQQAYNDCDALAIAPYITMCISPTGNPNSTTVAGWTVDQVLDYADQTALPQSINWMTTQRAVATKYNLQLLAYEGGQHLVGVGGGENNTQMTDLFMNANRDPRMKDLYLKYLAAWKQAGGNTFCIFAGMGSYSKWGSWGIIEHEGQDPTQVPKFSACLEFIQNNQQWW